MSISRDELRSHFAGVLRARSRDVTAQWVTMLSERLDVGVQGVLPSDSLLNHIPACLDTIADFLADPEVEFPLEFVQFEMTRLAHLRRQQGFGVNELLAEYGILTELLQRVIEEAAEELDGTPSPVDLVSVTGRFKDAIATLGVETARSYRVWQARERRERALQATSFAAMVQHELNNHLGSAQTAAELLAEGEVSSERRTRLAGHIVRSLHRALETVDVVKGIFSDSLPEEGTQVWLPLADVFQSVTTQETIVGEGARPSLKVGEAPNVTVPAARVGMVLLNLVHNAVKYHDADKDDRWVRIDASLTDRDDADGDWVEIAVRDNGRGIDPELHDSIFNFHVRGAVSESGSGLGLAFAQHAVHQLGGRIALDSTPGVGTTVTFSVPARRTSTSDMVSNGGVAAAREAR